ncbi:MAG TPA: NAD(P)/FAD-dependent oxidoreductase [Candidatus Limnocylindria bacterium]|nr:NAD(P)/FAD-dependent oxidoreductase [Candidatus Limnocylindria bacterium]
MPKHIIIVGGGVAGLAAAAALRGVRVTLLEAKDRFGGRIHTLGTNAGVIELGAEFVHGENQALLDVIHAAHLSTHAVSLRNQALDAGRLEPIEVWDTFSQLTQRIDPRANDTSFLEFLEAQSLDERTYRMMLAFAEGFNAAHAHRLSAHSLRRADYAAEQMEGGTQARIDAGYSALVERLVTEARSAGVKLVNGTTVRGIDWRAGHVTVETTHGGTIEIFDGEAAIITLPLGVLKARAVAFRPALPDKEEAINGLEFGNAVKLTLAFRRVWWLEADFGFIHALDEPIPTWWSDPRGPFLTGWAGGAKADALLTRTPAQLEALALDILSRLFSVPISNMQSELVASHTYDWAHDPHVRGAYSYIPVGGLFLPKQLGAPVDHTLFFAGEATAPDAQMGTVFGALESGQRAVREAQAA